MNRDGIEGRWLWWMLGVQIQECHTRIGLASGLCSGLGNNTPSYLNH